MAKRKKKQKDKSKLEVSYYLVAFIDLLGQQHHLRNLGNLPNMNKEEEMDSFLLALKNTYGAVTGMRKFFQDFFTSFSRNGKNYPGLNAEEVKLFNELDSNPIKFQRFSDAIVIYLSLDTRTKKLPSRGIYGVFGAAATTFLSCLAGGHPIRGGIDIGVAMEMSEGEIYGSALARAYALESKKAQYPRILVGSELINYLQLMANQDEKDIYAKVGKKSAEGCLNLVAIDNDGLPFIDYLGEHFQKNIASEMNTQVIQRAYDKILESSAQYQKENNTKLAFRYTLLRNYFESRIQTAEPSE